MSIKSETKPQTQILTLPVARGLNLLDGKISPFAAQLRTTLFQTTTYFLIGPTQQVQINNSSLPTCAMGSIASLVMLGACWFLQQKVGLYPYLCTSMNSFWSFNKGTVKKLFRSNPLRFAPQLLTLWKSEDELLLSLQRGWKRSLQASSVRSNLPYP